MRPSIPRIPRRVPPSFRNSPARYDSVRAASPASSPNSAAPKLRSDVNSPFVRKSTSRDAPSTSVAMPRCRPRRARSGFRQVNGVSSASGARIPRPVSSSQRARFISIPMPSLMSRVPPASPFRSCNTSSRSNSEVRNSPTRPCNARLPFATKPSKSMCATAAPSTDSTGSAPPSPMQTGSRVSSSAPSANSPRRAAPSRSVRVNPWCCARDQRSMPLAAISPTKVPR